MLNRISILTIIVLGIAVLATPSTAHAQTTWHVDDDAPNDPGPGDPSVSDPLEDGSSEHPFDAIQEGIDAAVDGDEVIIFDGTYAGDGNRDLDFGGNAITVRSASGDPALCIIDCEIQGSGFYFHSSEGPESAVEGLTIINGYAYGSGGGICFSNSSPRLINCTISGNRAYSYGGGIYCHYSNPTLAQCTISGNSVNDDGGGVGCYHGNPTLINCEISGNLASDGGGVCCSSSSPTIANCVISENTAADHGGGIRWGSNSRPKLTNCRISGNLSRDDGGGLYCSGNGNPTLNNCTIVGNSARFRGGGVFCLGNSPTLTNCTISGNLSDYGWGGGVYCLLSGNPMLANCILWGDTPQEIYVDDEGNPVVAYCDVQSGWPGTGNIDADPLFVDPDGPDDDPNTWEDNDYRLSAGSPCIDAADNTAVPLDLLDLDDDGDVEERIPFDLDGNPRFVQDPFTEDTGVPDPPEYRFIVDMGAYEYQFCFGDLDDDDDVDIADLAQLLASYGETTDMTYYDGDLDGDGDVDLADLAELLGAYGTVCE